MASHNHRLPWLFWMVGVPWLIGGSADLATSCLTTWGMAEMGVELGGMSHGYCSYKYVIVMLWLEVVVFFRNSYIYICWYTIYINELKESWLQIEHVYSQYNMYNSHFPRIKSVGNKSQLPNLAG